MLLHNGNKYETLPICHSTNTERGTKRYKDGNGSEHNWIICVDLKIVSMLMGQQKSYIKNPCILCT